MSITNDERFLARLIDIIARLEQAHFDGNDAEFDRLTALLRQTIGGAWLHG
jgi:hypothetical protein